MLLVTEKALKTLSLLLRSQPVDRKNKTLYTMKPATIVEKTFRHHERSVATWAYCTGLYKYTETFKGQNTRHAGKVITEILNKY